MTDPFADDRETLKKERDEARELVQVGRSES